MHDMLTQCVISCFRAGIPVTSFFAMKQPGMRVWKGRAESRHHSYTVPGLADFKGGGQSIRMAWRVQGMCMVLTLFQCFLATYKFGCRKWQLHDKTRSLDQKTRTRKYWTPRTAVHYTALLPYFSRKVTVLSSGQLLTALQDVAQRNRDLSPGSKARGAPDIPTTAKYVWVTYLSLSLPLCVLGISCTCTQSLLHLWPWKSLVCVNCHCKLDVEVLLVGAL